MASTYTLELTDGHPIAETRLQGRRLVIVRVIWAILVVLILGLFSAMLPAYFTKTQAVCTSSVCAFSRLTPDALRTLHAYGLTMADYAMFSLALIVFVTIICVVVALLIIQRKSDDWIALLMALTLVMEGTTFVTYTLEWSSSFWQIPAFLMSTLSWSAIYLLFSVFPDGRFVPRWTRWLVIAWIGYSAMAVIFPSFLSFNLFRELVWLCLCAGGVGAQIYRYKRVSNQVQRQQTKWIVYGTSVGTTVVIGLELSMLLIPSLGSGSLFSLLSWYGFVLALIPFPISIGFAVQRSRLWDIDNIINRTLVYTLLTVLLALLYFGSVTLLQYLFHTYTGQGSLVAVIGSTLTIAILFHPLRKYLQTTIDTNFYCRKYDISQVLASFDHTLQCVYSGDEESLALLSDTLREIVAETLQPLHLSLCLYEFALTKEVDETAKEAQPSAQLTSQCIWEDQEEAFSIRWDIADNNTSGRQKGRRGSFSAKIADLSARVCDYNVFINRALIYGTLLVILGLAATGILILQQWLAQVVSTQIAEFFIIGTILMLVICFKPLQRYIQSLIDRHFYQHKYRTEQTVDGFAAALRYEVNVTQVSNGLLEAVNAAMEPEHLSLWISKPEPEAKLSHYTGFLQQ